MDRRYIFILILISALVSALVLIVSLRSGDKVDQAGGTMATLCPEKVYQPGETFMSPCDLRPQEECTWITENNCEQFIKNTGDTPIHKGQRTDVFKSTVKGTAQFLEIQIIEIQ